MTSLNVRIGSMIFEKFDSKGVGVAASRSETLRHAHHVTF